MRKCALVLSLAAIAAAASAKDIALNTPNTTLLLQAEPGARVYVRYYGSRLDDMSQVRNANIRGEEAYPCFGYGSGFISSMALGVTHSDGDLVAGYTGVVDKSKRGLIWDDDPNVGDTIHITVIATGFNTSMAELTGNDYGKLIIVDKDFTYTDDYKPVSGEIQLTDEVHINKISYNTVENIPHFHFDTKPVLLVSNDQEISELTNTAAIRRTSRPQKQD